MYSTYKIIQKLKEKFEINKKINITLHYLIITLTLLISSFLQNYHKLNLNPYLGSLYLPQEYEQNFPNKVTKSSKSFHKPFIKNNTIY